MNSSVFLFFITKTKVRDAIAFPIIRSFSGQTKMQILNVAEKNDVAKNIAALLSRSAATRREGLSFHNKIYDFECEVFGQNSRMIMTSVMGHLLDMDFSKQYSVWKNCNPISLFKAPVKHSVKSNLLPIKKTLEREVVNCSKLIIWTDCDREGENIGFEIISVCKSIKPNIEVYRAKFSEITLHSVKKALGNLGPPNKHVSDAVQVRMELDLRIGAAFTRFQTLYLQKAFPQALNKNLISYGSCQFPTLGFVVERFKAISEFKPEPFWQINVQHTINKLAVDFHWKRNRLFNKLACEVLFDKCAENGTATVENVESKPKIKKRPKPLDTVSLQKLLSKRSGLTAKEILEVAEKLYVRGLISYPRTETTIFAKEINLVPLVQCQTNDPQWGEFAQVLLREGPNPFQGKKTDQAHPPIHPIKYSNELKGAEKTIYEFIVRHFLACLSKHAEGLETSVDIDVADEKFSAKGFTLTAKNYLEVYPYETWNDKEIHTYHKGETFKPEMSMKEGETTPPELLTEADLIGLMEKHGIGTDATHSEHIETIKARLYVGLQDGKYFVPRTLGMGLVEGYNKMGYGMAKPELRAELEADLKKISEGQKSPDEVLTKFIDKYKKVYEDAERQILSLIEAIQSYIEVEPMPVEPGCFPENIFEKVGRCPKCHSDLVIKKKKNGEKFIGCLSSPKCQVALWLPSFALDVSKTSDLCPSCGRDAHLLRFKFKKNSCSFPEDYVGCIGGCDLGLLKLLKFDLQKARSNISSVRNRPNRKTTSSALQEINSSDSDSLNERRDFLPSSKRLNLNPGRDSQKNEFFQQKNVDHSEKSGNSNRSATIDDEEEMRCYCSVPCRRLTATKEGPNKGRVFLTCGKSFRDPEKCSFFKWANCEKNLNNYANSERNQGRTEMKRGNKTWNFKADSQNNKRKIWTMWSLRS